MHPRTGRSDAPFAVQRPSARCNTASREHEEPLPPCDNRCRNSQGRSSPADMQTQCQNQRVARAAEIIERLARKPVLLAFFLGRIDRFNI